ncbi:dihydrofolate reductase-like, partial [Rhopilema esculentum]|uniref:dihydrofolate reductase-like n=1 Tax=Rhopilema esculentum TaxID=499914 RepID=UPI0031DFA891
MYAAMDAKRGIGKNNSLPWRLKNEMAYFTRITSSVKDAGKKNAVILGRKTWESIPKKYRPLPNRLNVVLSKTLCSKDVPDGVIVEKTLDSALQQISNRIDVEEVFVVGGSSVYEEAIKSPQCDRIYLTHVQGDYGCDIFFPQFDEEVYKKVRWVNLLKVVRQHATVQAGMRS